MCMNDWSKNNTEHLYACSLSLSLYKVGILDNLFFYLSSTSSFFTELSN